LNALRSLLSRLGLGRLAYHLLFKPVGAIRQSIREGGPLEQRQTRAGHIAMREAALHLPTMSPPPEGPNAEISYLSGPNFWHQTVFCFVSLQLSSPFRITPVIYDDGGLNEITMDRILRVIPWARFVLAEESEARLDELLPTARFPNLRARRRVYPHLRKLMDIHAGSSGFKLVADSDMLFFRRPNALLAWYASPHYLYMQDAITAYGYPLPFLSGLAGAWVPEPVNVGLYAVDGPGINWEHVEYWCRIQNDVYGPHYLQEQALTAMLFAGKPAIALPQDEYRVMPDDVEGQNPTAILHHYVDLSKRAYFRSGWRKIATMAQLSGRA
jgi:hypothetical protein